MNNTVKLELCKAHIPMRLPLDAFLETMMAVSRESGQPYIGFTTAGQDMVTSYTRTRDPRSADAVLDGDDCMRGMAALAARLELPLHTTHVRRDAVRIVLGCSAIDPWGSFDDIAAKLGERAYSVTPADHLTLCQTAGGVACAMKPAAVVVGPPDAAADLCTMALEQGCLPPVIEDFARGVAYVAS